LQKYNLILNIIQRLFSRSYPDRGGNWQQGHLPPPSSQNPSYPNQPFPTSNRPNNNNYDYGRPVFSNYQPQNNRPSYVDNNIDKQPYRPSEAGTPGTALWNNPYETNNKPTRPGYYTGFITEIHDPHFGNKPPSNQLRPDYAKPDNNNYNKPQFSTNLDRYPTSNKPPLTTSDRYPTSPYPHDLSSKIPSYSNGYDKQNNYNYQPTPSYYDRNPVKTPYYTNQDQNRPSYSSDRNPSNEYDRSPPPSHSYPSSNNPNYGSNSNIDQNRPINYGSDFANDPDRPYRGSGSQGQWDDRQNYGANNQWNGRPNNGGYSQSNNRPTFEPNNQWHKRPDYETGNQWNKRPDYETGNQWNKRPDYETGNQWNKRPDYETGNQWNKRPDYETGNQWNNQRPTVNQWDDQSRYPLNNERDRRPQSNSNSNLNYGEDDDKDGVRQTKRAGGSYPSYRGGQYYTSSYLATASTPGPDSQELESTKHESTENPS